MFNVLEGLKDVAEQVSNGEVDVKEITADMNIGSLLELAPMVAPILTSVGMHCLGCPSARGESIAQACAAHGIDCESLLAQLNAFVQKKD